MKKVENTPKQGSYRWLIFFDAADKLWYGAALEFNLVVSGDSKTDAFLELQEAVMGYIETANAIKGLRDFGFLNQTPDSEIAKLWSLSQQDGQIPSPYKFVMSGVSNSYA